jgi:hypothetical protein
VTTRLKFLVAFRPGFISPTLAAHQAATFQRISGGRLLLNVVTGGDSAEQRKFGDQLGHDQRYGRTEEFTSRRAPLCCGRAACGARADGPAASRTFFPAEKCAKPVTRCVRGLT